MGFRIELPAGLGDGRVTTEDSGLDATTERLLRWHRCWADGGGARR